jgi:hypothetical protein
MFRVVCLCAALVVTTPAGAQDLATQYAAAFQAFTVTGQSDRYFLQSGGVMANVLPTLAGRWQDVLTVSGYTASIDAVYIADICARESGGVIIASPGPNSFSVTKSSDENAFTVTYTHNIRGFGNWFDASFETEALAAYLGKATDDPLLAGLIALNELPIAVFTPGPDVLVMLPAGGMVQIYTRCPA